MSIHKNSQIFSESIFKRAVLHCSFYRIKWLETGYDNEEHYGDKSQRQPPEVFFKRKGVLKNFSKIIKFLKISQNFAKFLKNFSKITPAPESLF